MTKDAFNTPEKIGLKQRLYGLRLPPDGSGLGAAFWTRLGGVLAIQAGILAWGMGYGVIVSLILCGVGCVGWFRGGAKSTISSNLLMLSGVCMVIFASFMMRHMGEQKSAYEKDRRQFSLDQRITGTYTEDLCLIPAGRTAPSVSDIALCKGVIGLLEDNLKAAEYDGSGDKQRQYDVATWTEALHTARSRFAQMQQAKPSMDSH